MYLKMNAEMRKTHQQEREEVSKKIQESEKERAPKDLTSPAVRREKNYELMRRY